jgi:hypothetical protein
MPNSEKGEEGVNIHLSDTATFVGNLIALLALTWKFFYDIWWNPRRFREELLTTNELDAAKHKRLRTDTTNAITFLFLAISYAIFIGSTLK